MIEPTMTSASLAFTPSPPRPPTRTLAPNAVRQPAELSAANLRSNHDVGACLQDLLAQDDMGKNFRRVGSANADNPAEVWRDEVIRLYFQNVNGLSSSMDGTDIIDAFFHMASIKADIFAFAETHLNSHLDWLVALTHDCKRKVWEQCKLVFTSADNNWPTAYQRGGTMLGITGSLVGRYKAQITDDLGRWCGFELLGRNGRTLVILCCYQVIQSSGIHGPGTSYSQQVALLRLRGIDYPKPRVSFIRDLKQLIEKYHTADCDILLMGDFNEEVGLRADELAVVIQAGELTDIQAYCHGLDCEEPTYARGRRRVDYIFASDRLLSQVIRQGCEPFNMRIFSDHRGIFVDFSYPGFFDRSPSPLVNIAQRGFTHDRPDHIQRYLAYMGQYLQDHSIIKRIAKLSDNRDDNEANSVDRDMTIGMIKAAKNIKHFSRHPWSKALHDAITKRYIITKHLSQMKLRISMAAPITRMQLLLPSPVELPETVSETNACLRQAQRNCRMIVKKARALRATYQENKITAKQLANPEEDPEKIANSIKNRDTVREMWRKIPSSKPKTSSGLSMVKVPDSPDADPTLDTTTFISITEPNDMELRVTNRNIQHFKQTQGRPLTDPMLRDALGWCGTRPMADSILDGTADLDSLCANRHARDIFRHCKRVLDELPWAISQATLQDAYIHWPVTTSTGPSGRSLSHLHVLFHPHGIDKDDDPESFYSAQDTREKLWDVHHGIVSYATKHGFCFERWRNVVNTMIEKELGNPKLHRLRVIHLYENDYNLILGVKFREFMHAQEDHDTLNNGCYGSRANRNSLDPVFIELMQYDYCILTRNDEIDFINDAKSCYDCIVVPPSNVAARSRGLHKNITKIHGKMLQKAEYRIKTQLGIAKLSYKDSEDSPVYGTGQGSKSSPPIWANNCSIYFDIYDEQCHGAHYRDVFGNLRITLGMVGFVDDNKCQTNCHPRDRSTLAAKARADGQLWSNILDASGGGLEHPKLLYYWRQTEFDPHGFPILKAGCFGEPIVFVDEHGIQTTIKQRSVFKSYKTLGTHQSIGGQPKEQANVLLSRSKKLVRILATSSCNGNEAWQYYTSVFSKSIGYPLGTSRLLPKQVDAIQGPMVALILNRLGYPRRLSRCLTFGPRRYGGLGLPSAHTSQYTTEIKLFLRHLRTLGSPTKPHQPNILLRINLNRIQHCAGVGYPIFEFPARELPHLEGTWLPAFRSTLARVDGKLEIADLYIPPLQRRSDEYIMTRALASDKLTKREIKLINLCRYYFDGASTISDICNAAGTALAPGIMSGATLSLISSSPGNEPYQEKPGPLAWRAWRKFLRLICADHYGSLRTPLGPWLVHAPLLRRRWPFVYSRKSHQLFRWCNIEYEVLPLKRPMIYSFSPNRATAALPDDGVPVDVDIVSDGWRVRAVGQVGPDSASDLESNDTTQHVSNDTTHGDANNTPRNDAVLGFTEYLDTLPDHERLHLLHFDLLGNDVFDICDLLTDFNDILLVTDGGAVDDYGSYGWMLSNQHGRRFARGSGAAFGYTPGSYRAEISGCKGGLLFLIHLFHYCARPLPSGNLLFYCDNKSFIDKLTTFRSYRLVLPSCCLDAEWDLLVSVHTLMSRFPELPTINHVHGHQDRKKPYGELTLPAQLNVDADHVASYKLEHFGDVKRTVPFDPTSRVLLSLGGTTITRDYEDAIQDSLYLADLRGYLRSRFHWSLSTFESIDWSAYHTVYSKYARSRPFFYKFGWKKLPVGDRLHQREDRFDHRCPSCLQPNETDDHVYQCIHNDRKRWRLGLVTGIIKRLGAFLDPELIALIRTGLHSYFGNKPELVSIRFPSTRTHCHKYGTSSITDRYCRLAASQSAIGWDQFLRGRIAKDWQKLQFRYATRYNLVDKSKQWHTWLIRYMANNSFDLWCQRNRHRHGSDSATRHDKALEQAKRDVRHLYTLREQVLPQDSNLFSSDMDAHLGQTLANLQEWLSVNKKLINHSVRKAKDNASKTKYNAREYFNVRKRSKAVNTPKATAHRTGPTPLLSAPSPY